MLTAGHCALSVGTTVFTGGSTSATAHTSMGSITARTRTQNGYDSALIGGGSYGAFVWVSTPTGLGDYPISSYVNPVDFEVVCRSGATSGYNCNLVTGGSTTVCATFTDGVTTCHLTIAVSNNGATSTCLGDSGGPIITPGSLPKAVGIIIGASPTCGANGRTYYHAVSPLLALWGATFG